MTEPDAGTPNALIVGASRGLGLAIAGELASRGWQVCGTVRGGGRTELHALAERHEGRITLEQLDITVPEEIDGLRDRLAGRVFDLVLVNSGVAGPAGGEALAGLATGAFVQVMIVNVLGVMRAVEAFAGLARADGVVGVMSSGQGSLARNEGGGDEVYRASKAALNQAMRSYAARHAGEGRALVLMAPGWIRTDLGGPKAPVGVGEAIPPLVDTLIAQAGTSGLRFIDRNGQSVPW